MVTTGDVIESCVRKWRFCKPATRRCAGVGDGVASRRGNSATRGHVSRRGTTLAETYNGRRRRLFLAEIRLARNGRCRVLRFLPTAVRQHDRNNGRAQLNVDKAWGERMQSITEPCALKTRAFSSGRASLSTGMREIADKLTTPISRRYEFLSSALTFVGKSVSE